MSNKIAPKPASLIVSLDILDDLGRVVSAPYKLKTGTNIFTCQATYIDGTKEEFAAYWMCPMILPRGGVDFYGAIGTDKHSSVTVNAAPNHIKYTNLSCWVKFPDGPQTDAGQYPNKSIKFDYSDVVNG